MQVHAFFKSTLYSSPCFIQVHALFKSTLYSSPCFIQVHALFKSTLFSSPRFIQVHVFFPNFTLAKSLQLTAVQNIFLKQSEFKTDVELSLKRTSNPVRNGCQIEFKMDGRRAAHAVKFSIFAAPIVTNSHLKPPRSCHGVGGHKNGFRNLEKYFDNFV